MSLENEYYHFKRELRSEKEELEKFESLDVTQMDEMQLKARQRGIASCKESINELEGYLQEVKEELKEFIKEGGEVSQKTFDEFKKEEDEESSSSVIIEIVITEFEQGTTFLADENPIVNDRDYCEVLKTPDILNYTVNGTKCHIQKVNSSKEELIKESIPQVIFNEWFEENWSKTFSDLGISAPLVYDFEEDDFFKVDSIDNFVNNCTQDSCFKEYRTKLQEIAEKEFTVDVTDLSE